MPLQSFGRLAASIPTAKAAMVEDGFFGAVLAAINCCAVPFGLDLRQVMYSPVSDALMVISFGADGGVIGLVSWFVERI